MQLISFFKRHCALPQPPCPPSQSVELPPPVTMAPAGHIHISLYPHTPIYDILPQKDRKFPMGKNVTFTFFLCGRVELNYFSVKRKFPNLFKSSRVPSLAIDDKESRCEKRNSSEKFPSSHIYKFIHICPDILTRLKNNTSLSILLLVTLIKINTDAKFYI